MGPRQYHEPDPATAGAVRTLLAGGRTDIEVSRALVGAAFHDPDRESVQTLCLELLRGPEAELAALAATCLGHLARIHRELDLDLVRPAFDAVRDHPLIGPRVEDAEDDIRMFLHPSRDG